MPESQRRPHARDPSPAASLAARGLPTLYQPKRRPPPADRDSSPAEPSTPRSPRPSDVHRRGAGRAGHATRLPPRRWRRARPHHAHRPKRRPPPADRLRPRPRRRRAARGHPTRTAEEPAAPATRHVSLRVVGGARGLTTRTGPNAGRRPWTATPPAAPSTAPRRTSSTTACGACTSTMSCWPASTSRPASSCPEKV